MPTAEEMAHVDALLAAWRAEVKPATHTDSIAPKPRYLSKRQLAMAAAPEVLKSRPDWQAALAQGSNDQPDSTPKAVASRLGGWDREADPLVLAARRERDQARSHQCRTPIDTQLDQENQP